MNLFGKVKSHKEFKINYENCHPTLRREGEGSNNLIILSALSLTRYIPHHVKSCCSSLRHCQFVENLHGLLSPAFDVHNFDWLVRLMLLVLLISCEIFIDFKTGGWKLYSRFGILGIKYLRWDRKLFVNSIQPGQSEWRYACMYTIRRKQRCCCCCCWCREFLSPDTMKDGSYYSVLGLVPPFTGRQWRQESFHCQSKNTTCHRIRRYTSGHSFSFLPI